MSLTFEESVSATGKSTTVNVNLSAATEDHLLVAVSVNTGVSDPSISGSGWTVGTNTLNGVTVRTKSWWKVAGAGEPTSITFTWGGGVNACGAALRLSGVDTADAFENDGGSVAGGSDASAECGTAGGGTAAGKVCYAGFDDTTVLSGVDSGFTNRVDVDQGNCSLYVATDEADGSSENPVITATTSAIWAAGHLAFNSAGAADINILRLRAEGY